MKRLYLSIVLLALFLSILYAKSDTAAVAQSLSFNEPVLIQVSPESPRPGQTVTISLQSYTTDLNRADIQWRIDGKPLRSGIGVTHTTIQMGVFGTVARVSIAVKTSEGTSFSKEIVLRPTEVDIVWETKSYTPPWYKGKALAAAGSSVTVSAFARLLASNGQTISPKELVYQWRQDGKTLGNLSGYGKSTITIPGPRFEATVISVTVSNYGNTVQGMGGVTIQPETPKVLVYEDNPLLGVRYEAAIQNSFSLTGSETRVSAQPYFFAVSNRNDPALEYQWEVNGEEVASGDTPSSLVLRPGSGSGFAKIAVGVQHTRVLLQRAGVEFLAQFGGQDFGIPFFNNQ